MVYQSPIHILARVTSVRAYDDQQQDLNGDQNHYHVFAECLTGYIKKSYWRGNIVQYESQDTPRLLKFFGSKTFGKIEQF